MRGSWAVGFGCIYETTLKLRLPERLCLPLPPPSSLPPDPSCSLSSSIKQDALAWSGSSELWPGCSSYRWMSCIPSSEGPGIQNKSTVSFTDESGFQASCVNAKIIDFCLAWCQAFGENFYSDVIFSVHPYYIIKFFEDQTGRENQSKRWGLHQTQGIRSLFPS